MVSIISRPCGPLIRWAGSKRQLLSSLKAKIPKKYGRYIEPFAGSACLFFAIQPKRALLADLNPDLVDAYETISKHPTRVLRLAKANGAYASNYYIVRAINPKDLSPTHRAARFLYLNRFCFNAIYRTNRTGQFNVPFGSRTGDFPSETNFVRSATLLRRAQLLCTDFEHTLSLAKRSDFVYLDPPYVSSKRVDRNEYGNGSFSVPDLPRLITNLETLHSNGIHFLLSYSFCADILDLLPRKVTKTINVRRHVSGKLSSRGMAKEILVTNEDLFS